MNMKSITFKIHYQTQWGQRLAVFGPLAELGAGAIANAFPLEYTENGWWQGTLSLEKVPKNLTYQYVILREGDEAPEPEWGDFREIEPGRFESIILQDTWRAGQHPENALMSSAFTSVIFQPAPRATQKIRRKEGQFRLRFNFRSPRVAPDCELVVCGSHPALGAWDIAKAPALGSESYPQWTGEVTLDEPAVIEYKYVWRSTKGDAPVWESGPNRRVACGGTGDTLVLGDAYFQYPGGGWKGAGLAIPVFSIRTQKSFGVGEFADIRLLVDWAKKMGMNMVQILPVNDTTVKRTWEDSYPYESISVFALHPIYLRVELLPAFSEVVDQKAYDEDRRKLNAAPHLEYESVIKHKLKYTRLIFDIEKETFLKSKTFRKFMKESEHWLKPYAAFSYLRDRYGTADFNQWEEERVFSQKLLKKITSPRAKHYDEIAFYYYLQFHLDLQLANAADYARKHGVVLKGDIPIGINRESVDAWEAPHLYNMDGQAGAPPDPFADKGQNWGFPTYDWERMAEDGFQWWRNRFSQMSRYVDAFRIDHILGFFRIWQIPLEQVEGIMGFFNSAIPVDRDEFAAHGIDFSYDRYCKPYLPAHHVDEVFGEEAEYVRRTFLREVRPGFLQMKSEFESQREVRTFLEQEENAEKKHLEEKVFDLISNVLFFEVPGSEGRQFHPRIKMEETYSFQALDGQTQQRAYDLYIDYFYRRQEGFWREKAMEKLPAIRNATNMLICGEDLGMVPDCVPGVMRELEILSLEIQRMSKNPATEFLAEGDIPYLSVCSPSTHDMSPLRLWWEEEKDDYIQRFYNGELGLPGAKPRTCEPYVSQAIIKQHLHWPCMWAVFPLQDLLGMDADLRYDKIEEERINVPSNPNHYWRYRMHLTVEELLAADEFNEKMRAMLKASGR